MLTSQKVENATKLELSEVTVTPKRDSMYPKKGESQEQLSTLIPHTIALFFCLRIWRKKMELKSPETPHPREPGHMP